MSRKLKSLTYSQLVVFGYLFIISLGTILLLLPVASRGGVSAGLLTSFFTATSATCVTGLVVRDTYTQWSLFGQIVIILLIQVGGLGFMTVITLFSFLINRRIGLKERGLLQESISTMHIGGVVYLIKKILVGTFIIESLGVVILSIRFIPQMGFREGLFNSIFHSVSAFCNAGFDLMGKYGKYSSLTAYSNDPIVCLTIALLIVIGGIGFFVWNDILENRSHFKKYRLHSKIVLSMTALLILAGAVLFYFFERNNVLLGKPFGEKLLVSVFHSITPRTAGFNSVEMAALTPASKLMTIILMLIGGSPGSTAGGIKTTTLAVVLLSVWSSLRNIRGEHVFGRQLEESALKKANMVIVINLALLLTGAMIIGISNTSLSSGDILFEVSSAIGTVGLTVGITESLTAVSQIVIIFLMYCGRVGSVSFALLFTEHGVPFTLQKPTEKINIG
jgi:trk system potassium uptake protein TrkH